MAFIEQKESKHDIGIFKNLPYLPTHEEVGEGVVMLESDELKKSIFIHDHMCMNIMATTLARHGSAVSATNIAEVAKIGIFLTWTWRRRLGKLCEQGYFKRYHVGTEEYFTPTEEFEKLVEKHGYIIIQ